MAGGLGKLTATIFTDWVFGAFISATIDAIMSNIKIDNPIVNICGGVLQLSFVNYICYEFMLAFGSRTSNQTLQGSIFLGTVIWAMSPNAVSRLVKGYYSIHRFLYGENFVPSIYKAPTSQPCCDSCAESTKNGPVTIID